MASITSVGVGSGIDLESLVEKIISAERTPSENRLNLEQTEIEAQISAMGSLRLTMDAFQQSLSDLKNASFFSERTATVSDSSLISVSTDSDADISNYNVEVFEKANANKIASSNDYSDPSATVGSGTLTIGFEGQTGFDISVAVTDSIADIRDAINAASDNTGITASIITVDAGLEDGSTISKFVFSANETGAVSQINIRVADDDATNEDGNGLSQFFYNGSLPLDASNQFSQIDAAQDARIAVDGFTAFSSTNTFDGIIDGVAITILQEADDILNPPSSSLNISVNKTQVNSAVETFVATYNELITVFNALTNYDTVSGTSGLLTGDSGVNALERGIRRVLSNTVEGAASDLSSLNFIGISTNSNGSVGLDSDKLTEAISNRFDDLGTLFSSEDGVAAQLDELLEGYLQLGGVFDNRNESLDVALNDIQDQRDNLSFRIDVIEQRYRSQFAALDILVSQINSTSDFLQQQLSASAAIVNRDNS
jgi:flagellar hook-associated protein 2